MQKTFLPADILLPKCDFEKWSVIACDQYTSDNEYWEDVYKTVGSSFSSLHLVLPEIYLDDADKRISNINETMQQYINDGVFTTFRNSYIYVERTLKSGAVRKGIVGKIDLTDYNFKNGSNALIRATEATVTSRIPPRVKIRENATLELPHVMLLADDRDNLVFKIINDEFRDLKVVYDFELIKDGGHIKGYLIDGENAKRIQAAFTGLIGKSKDKMLFAVGDGNHSLAAAKVCAQQFPNEFNRFALVEVVNIHDNSLNFEPIYRVLFNVDPDSVIKEFVDFHGGEYFGEDSQKFTCIFGDTSKTVSIKATSKLSVGTLQKFLDRRLPDVKIDYIHDVKAVKKLCKNQNTLGFIFDSMKKDELFSAVKADGALPRKTFSIGSADDKRFYLEARIIK